ncbi:T9SS type A sorting domain-containing protein [Flavobacterium sp. 3HN19-14]|uniref:T9SS type A sorting domain-containing protein n=1 Tax=Flavobacterium sp. 3HN19-14 TaxID=3448133 RepID=UPI003EE0558D
MHIEGNPMLSSISGIQNIDPELLTNLILLNSQSLSACSYPNICTYLSNGGNYTISGNSLGCQNVTDVLNACGLGNADFNSGIRYYPNPVARYLTLEEVDFDNAAIYNSLGQNLETFPKATDGHNYQIDMVNYEKGIYFLKIVQGTKVKVLKFLKS